MAEKTLLFIALPVKSLYPVLELLSQEQARGLTEAEAREVLSKFTKNKVKTTENYVRSLKYLGLVDLHGDVVKLTEMGHQLISAGPEGWRAALTAHCGQIPQLKDIGKAIIDLGAEGSPMTSSRWYYDLVAKRLLDGYGFTRVSIRRVDNYISLFREINFLSLIGGRFPVHVAVGSPTDLFAVLKVAFEDLKAANPLFSNMPWLPIVRLEEFVLQKTDLPEQLFWPYLLDLRRQRKVQLVQTKPGIAAQAGLKMYEANGVAYGSVGLRG